MNKVKEQQAVMHTAEHEHQAAADHGHGHGKHDGHHVEMFRRGSG